MNSENYSITSSFAAATTIHMPITWWAPIIFICQNAAIGSAMLYRGTEKSLAQPGRKQAVPVKSVMGRGMDCFG